VADVGEIDRRSMSVDGKVLNSETVGIKVQQLVGRV
jgi:hypothetical protein